MPLRVRGLEGPVQLHLPAAGRRGGGRRPAAGPDRRCRTTPRSASGARSARPGDPPARAPGRRHTVTGDRAELAWEPSPSRPGPRSASAPGSARARPGARPADGVSPRPPATGPPQADVVIVNTHLYATALATGGELLPPHDLVVFDEAHELEDIASAALRLRDRRRAASRRWPDRPGRCSTTPPPPPRSRKPGWRLAEGLCAPPRRHPAPTARTTTARAPVTVARERVARLQAEVRRAMRPGADGDAGADPGIRARYLRAQQAPGHLLGDLDQVMELSEPPGRLGRGARPRARCCEVAPLDVGEAFRERLWSRVDAPTAVLTSATIPPRLGRTARTAARVVRHARRRQPLRL